MLTNANAEYMDKLQCADFETRMRESDLQGASITTAAAIPAILGGCSPYSGLSVGEYVDVSADLTAGKCSHGGMAYLIARSSPGANATYTVSFRNKVERLKSISETNVPISRLTLMPLHVGKLPERSREKSSPVASRRPSEAKKPLSRQIQTLCDHLCKGFSLGRSKGWRAKDLFVHVLLKSDKEQLFMRDLLELRGLLSAKDHNNHSIRDAKSGKLEKRRAKHNPLTMLYLTYSWGFGKNQPQRVLARIAKEGTQFNSINETTTENPTRQCVITSIKAARLRYTARSLFMRAEINQQKVKDTTLAYESQKEKEYEWGEIVKADWCLLDDANKQLWLAHNRRQIARQPFIKDQILDAALRQNPTKGFEKVSGDIDG